MEASGGIYHSPAFKLPAGYITSSVGAGDAFCAGLLGSLIFSQPLEYALYHANLCAAMSMRSLDPSSGVVDLIQASNFVERYGITQAKESSYES